MIEKAVSSWLPGGRLAHLGVVVLIGTLLLANGGCTKKKKTLSSIEDAYTRQDYDETMVLCEHALKNNVVDGDIYLYYGMALVAIGRDFESFDRFERAVQLDGSLSGFVAGYLEQKGRESFAAGEGTRAARRLRAAVEFDPRVELGALKYVLADEYFGAKEFDKAARLYTAALEEFPDTVVAEEALFNLSASYSALGDSAAAMEVLERQLALFPRGGLARQAEWRLVNMFYDSAQSEFERGNYETVIEVVTELLARTENVSLIQRARFLLGETYERMGEFDKAYVQYKAIIQEDRGASGRIVARARAKIDALRDAGLL